MKQLKSWFVLTGAVLALAACGGGGDGDGGVDPGPGQADPLDGIPGEATQSVSGWIGYLVQLVKATDADERDSLAPPDQGPAGLPADDEGEPVAPT